MPENKKKSNKNNLSNSNKINLEENNNNIQESINLMQKRLFDDINEELYFYKSLYDNSLNGNIIADSSGLIISLNNSTEKLLEIKKENIIGKTIWEFLFEILSEEDRLKVNFERIKLTYLLIIKTGQLPTSNTKRIFDIIKQDGQRRNIEFNYNLIKTNSRNYICEILRDVSELHSAKKSLFRLSKALDSRVLEKTQEMEKEISERKKMQDSLLKRAIELERSNAELQQFAHVASHDLQEPLRMIASYVQLLEKRYKGKLDEDADDYIAFASEGASRMQQLIQDLLAFSRVQFEGNEFSMCNLNNLLKETLKVLSNLIISINPEITYEELPTAYADEFQILQLFQNIIHNALKFRKAYEILKIHIACRTLENEFVISISDNGIGIKEEYHEKIFKIFQRLHNRNEYEGNGIGLAVCKRIVERHEGRIWLRSELGVGTTFYFTLPINKMEPVY